MSVEQQDTVREAELLQRIDLRNSLLYGCGAWVVGFVLTHVLVSTATESLQSPWIQESGTDLTTAVYLSSYGAPIVVEENTVY